MADLQPGRKVEVKLRKGEPKPVAEWIKVQVAGAKP
jgi:cold shock CspA family protein